MNKSILILTFFLFNCTSPIIKATKDNNTNEMSKLIDNGADINKSYTFDGDPLTIALKQNHREAVQLLINKGVNPNGNSLSNYPPPLFVFAMRADQEMVEFLLNKGANPNFKKMVKFYEPIEDMETEKIIPLETLTAIVNAYFYGLPEYRTKYPSIMKILLKHSDMKLETKKEAFFQLMGTKIVGQDDSMAVEVLSNIPKKDWDYEIYLRVMQSESEQLLNYLISNSSPPTNPVNDETLLHYLYGKSQKSFYCTIPENINSLDKIYKILQKKISIDAKDKYGFTVLHHLIRNRKDFLNSCFTHLVKNHKANINVQDNFGWTPLHHSIFTQPTPAIKILFKELKANPKLKINGYDTNEKGGELAEQILKKGNSAEDIWLAIYKDTNVPKEELELFK
jgi:ankyrin repeat protein